LIGGALATAGNVVFMGEGNGWFDAFNEDRRARLALQPGRRRQRSAHD
jgi:hypothetical protein